MPLDTHPPGVTPSPTAPADTPAAEPTASSYLRAIRLHWIPALLVLVATVAAAVGWSAVKAPVYQATAEVLVTPLSTDQQSRLGLPLLVDSGDAARTMQTAAALLASHEVAAAAARELAGHWTGPAVQRRVDVTPEGETNLVAITARGGTPTEAARIANTYVTSALDFRGMLVRRMADGAAAELKRRIAASRKDHTVVANLRERLAALQSLRSTNDPTLSIAERATLPSSAAGASRTLVIALSLVAGLVLASGLALILEILPIDRIRSENDLLSTWSLPVLARVPIVRGRRDDVVTEAQLHAALRNVHRQLEVSHHRTRVVLITSPSRGDGKTTACVALANVVADGGANVILIDADVGKADLRRVDGVRTDSAPAPGAASLPAAARLTDVLVPVAEGSRVQTVDLSVDDLWQLRAAGIEDSAVKQAALLADYVVIDTPPLGEVSDALLLVAEVDAVIVVARIGHTRKSDLETARDLLRRTRIYPAGLVIVGGRAARPYPYRI
jgi:capsular polysaccharide biosynthesis protein